MEEGFRCSLLLIAQYIMNSYDNYVSITTIHVGGSMRLSRNTDLPYIVSLVWFKALHASILPPRIKAARAVGIHVIFVVSNNAVVVVLSLRS